jgi:hypothetical protein
MGTVTTASGPNSTAIGFLSTASGNGSIVIGNGSFSTALSSVAIGTSVKATGNWSVALGNYIGTNGKLGSFAIGDYDGTSLVNDADNQMLMRFLGGYKFHLSDATLAMAISSAGNVGIGLGAPDFPLSFSQALGDKISLWSNSSTSYGFGIQSGLLQIHTDVSYADIAFGYGSSTAFTETMRITGTGTVGIGTTTPNHMLDVNGYIQCWQVVETSDSRFKRDITPIQNALQRVTHLNGYNYYWKNMQLDSSLQAGVIAQEVQLLFPELVNEDDQGMLSVNYSGLIAVLIESIKDQQHRLEHQHEQMQSQQRQIEKQQDQIDMLEQLFLEIRTKDDKR